jgi:hypothetical protein
LTIDRHQPNATRSPRRCFALPLRAHEYGHASATLKECVSFAAFAATAARKMLPHARQRLSCGFPAELEFARPQNLSSRVRLANFVSDKSYEGLPVRKLKHAAVLHHPRRLPAFYKNLGDLRPALPITIRRCAATR